MKTLAMVVGLAAVLSAAGCGSVPFACTATHCDPNNDSSNPYEECITRDGAYSYNYGKSTCQCANKTDCATCKAEVSAWCTAPATDGGTETCVPTTCGANTYQVCSQAPGARRYDYGRFTCECASTTDCVDCDKAVASWCTRSSDLGT